MRGTRLAAVTLVAVTTGCAGPGGPVASVTAPLGTSVPPPTPATSGPAASSPAAPSQVGSSQTVSSQTVSSQTVSSQTVSSQTVSSPSSRPSARATAGGAVIPVEFRGSWNTDPKLCGTDSEGSMVADAHTLRYYEGGGPVTSVVRKGEVITVTATWNAEGSVQTESFDLSVSADGRTVTDLTTHTVRHRCP